MVFWKAASNESGSEYREYQNMTSAYIIANVSVTDPLQYEEYRKWSSAAIQAHGAEVCVRGGRAEVLEGDWAPERLVVLKFPTFAAAKAFAASPEYGRARAARAGAAIMRMVVVEGV
jgi:uncharacterized protein (DUF1330 family)